MNRTKKLLLSALISANRTRPSLSSSPLRLLSTKNNSDNSKFNRSSLILQEFHRRREKGAAKSEPSKMVDCFVGGADVVSGFGELGLTKELIAAAADICGGGAAPSEIQCVGIPAVLDGKSVVLSSEAGSPRTLAYLLPLVQLLRRDTVSMKPKRPRAVVLCTTEEMSDECFQMGKYISDHNRLKSSTEYDCSESEGLENTTTPPLGMLVGTPSEILQQIEEDRVFCDDVKYLVVDEADAMLRQGLGPMIQKIVSQLPDHMGIQTIVVASPAPEILGKQTNPVMERLGKNHAGEIAAIMLEIDRMEVFDLLVSLDALMSKVAEAMGSLCCDPPGS